MPVCYLAVDREGIKPELLGPGADSGGNLNPELWFWCRFWRRGLEKEGLDARRVPCLLGQCRTTTWTWTVPHSVGLAIVVVVSFVVVFAGLSGTSWPLLLSNLSLLNPKLFISSMQSPY